VGTTFGSYGYGSMSNDDAVKIVQRLKVSEGDDEFILSLSNGDKAVLERLLKRL